MPRQIKGLDTVTAPEVLAEITKALNDLDTAETNLSTLSAQLEQAKQGSTRAAELEARVATAEKAAQEAQALISTLNAQLSAAQKGEKLDITAIIAETASKTRAEVERQAAADRKTLEDRLVNLEGQRQADQLAAVRAEVIDEANGEIIEAMVRGNTEEEIRASAVEAKAAYASVAARQAPAARAAGVPPVVSTRPKGGNPAPQGDNLSNFRRSGDRQTFSKDRSALLAAARKRFG